MNISDFAILSDENIHPEVVAYLRNKGFDVLDVKEEGWQGKKDSDLIAISHEQGRVVITHDGDFGLLAVMTRVPFTGIIYIRPGDIKPLRIINQLERFIEAKINLKPQFMIVIQKNKIRVRTIEREE